MIHTLRMCTALVGWSRVRVWAGDKPVVQRITQQEIVKVLPWSGSGARLRKEVGTAEACTARVASSLVACALIYQNSIEVASAAALYWAWGPIWSTVLSNSLLRLRYRYAGVWTARVLEVQVLAPLESAAEGADLLGGIFNRLPVFYPTLQLLIGDDSPAKFQAEEQLFDVVEKGLYTIDEKEKDQHPEMDVVMTEEVPRVKVGERVEVLVMSDRPGLSRFNALRDVYLPQRDVWISEEPYIERECFERLLRKLPAPVAAKREYQGLEERPEKLYLEEKTTARKSAKWVKAVKTRPKAKQSNLFESDEFEMDYEDDERIDSRLNRREPARPFLTEEEPDKQRGVQEFEDTEL